MSIAKYVLLAYYAIAALLIVSSIGKPKTPTTPAVAAASLVLMGALCWLVVLA